MQRRHLLLTGLAVVAPIAHAGSYDDFFQAIIRDDAGVLASLLRRGFDPNTRDPNGEVGLTLALKRESLRAFGVLMQSRATQVEARNAKDESPLMLAALYGRLEAARQLIARDADVNKTGWTPLHYAASGEGDHQVDMVALLLEHSAYIDAESPNRTTPLMMAARYGSEAVVQRLLDEGADATLKNQQGLTVLDFAQQSDRQFMVDKMARVLRQPSRQLPRAPVTAW